MGDGPELEGLLEDVTLKARQDKDFKKNIGRVNKDVICVTNL